MNKILISLMVCILLISSFSVSVFAYKEGELEYELIDGSIGGIQYTPQCLTDCHLPIKVKWDEKKLISKNDMKYDRIKGYDFKINILNNISYKKDVWIPDIKCKMEQTPNGTQYEVCEDKGHLEKYDAWRWEWSKFPTSLSMKKEKWYILDFHIDVPAKLGRKPIDLIPNIKTKKLKELAWFNFDWGSCRNLTITTTQNETNLPLTFNFTSISLTNENEGRLVNSSCGNDGFAQNYTTLSNSTSGGNLDWAEITWSYSGGNDTWSFYYNNSEASDPNYGFLLFNPDFTVACDFTNDWVSGDQAKYSCQSGFMNATAVDSGQFDSDQLQSLADFSVYEEITFWNIVEDTGTNLNLDSNRYMTGTNIHGTWLNTYNLLANNDNPDEFRLIANNVAIDIDSNVDVPVSENFSVKVHYNVQDNDAFLFIINTSADTQLWSQNITTLQDDIEHWGTWTDISSADIFYYDFLIYLGFQNPRVINLPTLSLGNETFSGAPPEPFRDIRDNTFYMGIIVLIAFMGLFAILKIVSWVIK